jgi:hypothetical protein
VFALKLNREEFAKNSIGLIRRKFLIDAQAAASAGHPPFRNHTCEFPETRRSPSVLIERGIRRRKRRGDTVFGCNVGRLSVRLMSL